VKRVVHLTAVALVVMLILMPSVMAQQTTQEKGGSTAKTEQTMESTQPLPKSGGVSASSVLLPASALLLGSGVLAYAILRRR
jgi:ABC-type cobalt transport system substrate-binding protein